MVLGCEVCVCVCLSRRDWFVDLFWILNVKIGNDGGVLMFMLLCVRTQNSDMYLPVETTYARDRGHYQTYTPVTSWNG